MKLARNFFYIFPLLSLFSELTIGTINKTTIFFSLHTSIMSLPIFLDETGGTGSPYWLYIKRKLE
jgi:hypothetical protein